MRPARLRLMVALEFRPGASMNQEEIARYRRRAAEEREQAASTGNPRAAQSHLELAGKYDAVVAAYQARSGLRGRGTD